MFFECMFILLRILANWYLFYVEHAIKLSSKPITRSFTFFLECFRMFIGRTDSKIASHLKKKKKRKEKQHFNCSKCLRSQQNKKIDWLPIIIQSNISRPLLCWFGFIWWENHLNGYKWRRNRKERTKDRNVAWIKCMRWETMNWWIWEFNFCFCLYTHAFNKINEKKKPLRNQSVWKHNASSYTVDGTNVNKIIWGSYDVQQETTKKEKWNITISKVLFDVMYIEWGAKKIFIQCRVNYFIHSVLFSRLSNWDRLHLNEEWNKKKSVLFDQTYRPVFVIIISVPISWNFCHKSMFWSVAFTSGKP